MRFKILCILLGVGIGALNGPGWAVVASASSTLSNRSGTASPALFDPGNAVDPQSGYIAWRWIGTLRPGNTECPPADGWSNMPLFQIAEGQLTSRNLTAADLRQLHTLGLDRFCVYTRQPGRTQRFVPPAGLEEARPDRMAVSVSSAGDMGAGTASPPGTQTVDRILADELLHQTGSVTLPLKNQPNVQITFLDSEPDGPLQLKPHAGSQHGYTLAHLAEELVCNRLCAATISNLRTLGYDDPNQSPLSSDRAGSIGAIAELGPRIVQAVAEWQRSRHPKHLVLNLSIGWDGEVQLIGKKTDLTARRVSDLEPSVQAVYLALQWAASKGVLVIAAAGNRRGGSLHDSNWPLLPAAWELHPPSRSPFGPKLVYAVGGVDWQGLPLPNSRTRGLPQRVAYGDHAVVEVGGRSTAILTGTSVSAAVVSSVAAVVWDLRPDLKPAEVMRLIDTSGTPTPEGVRADFHRGWRRPRIRVISLCTGMERACGRNGKDCGSTLAAVPRCTPLDWQPPVFAGLSLSLGSGALYFQPTETSSSPPCDSRTRLFSAGGPVSPPYCPTDQFLSVSSQRWIFPQPGADPCPNCVLFPTGPPSALSSAVAASAASMGSGSQPSYQLAVEIDPSWITSLGGAAAMLDIDCFAGGELRERMTYPIQLDLTSRTRWIVPDLGNGRSLKDCRAQLNWVVTTTDGPRSVQSPVVVDP